MHDASGPGTSRGRSGTIIAAVVFSIMAAGAVYRYWPSDEREIRRHLSSLGEALSTPGAESEVARLTRMAALREYFAPDVRVRMAGEELVSRDAVIGAIGRMPVPPGGIGVEFVDVTVAIAAEHRTAEVALTARLASTDPASGESTIDERPARLTMSQAAGDWVITTAESGAAPSRP